MAHWDGAQGQAKMAHNENKLRSIRLVCVTAVALQKLS